MRTISPDNQIDLRFFFVEFISSINFFFIFQTFLAKATYDNIAESPDEIAFRRGDVVTVIEQDTSGLEGWWLCSLRGKTGIAPGNRLKLLSGMLESPGNNSVCRSPSSVNKVSMLFLEWDSFFIVHVVSTQMEEKIVWP